MSTHRIPRARDAAGLSLGQAAKLLGVTREVVLGWEMGTPDDLTFARLARLYRVNIPWLRGDVPLKAESLDAVVCVRVSKRAKRRNGISDHDRDVLLEAIASSKGVKP